MKTQLYWHGSNTIHGRRIFSVRFSRSRHHELRSNLGVSLAKLGPAGYGCPEDHSLGITVTVLVVTAESQ